MRKIVVYGILFASLHGIRFAAKSVAHGAKKAAHIAYKVAV